MTLRCGLEYFLIPFLEESEDLDTDKPVTISLGAQLPVQEFCSVGTAWFCCMITQELFPMHLKCMWFTSSHPGLKLLREQDVAIWSAAMPKYFKIWALANYFSRTGYSQLNPSVSAASTSLTHQNLPKAKLISFFLLFFLSLWPAKSTAQPWFPLPAGILWRLCGSTIVWNRTFL